MSSNSDKKRKDFKENDDKRDFGLTTPKDIERFDNIKYGDNDKWQVLDDTDLKMQKTIFLLLLVCMVVVGYMAIRKYISTIV